MATTEILTTRLTETNPNTSSHQLVSMQLSYSTADIEKTIFFAPEYTLNEPTEPLGKATILLVHGDMFILEEGPVPQPSPPLTEDSGLFRIAGMAEQAGF